MAEWVKPQLRKPQRLFLENNMFVGNVEGAIHVRHSAHLDSLHEFSVISGQFLKHLHCNMATSMQPEEWATQLRGIGHLADRKVYVHCLCIAFKLQRDEWFFEKENVCAYLVDACKELYECFQRCSTDTRKEGHISGPEPRIHFFLNSPPGMLNRLTYKECNEIRKELEPIVFAQFPSLM